MVRPRRRGAYVPSSPEGAGAPALLAEEAEGHR